MILCLNTMLSLAVQRRICSLNCSPMPLARKKQDKLIVDTWMQYVRNKRTVAFCASVKHAEQIAAMFREQGIHAAAVSGSMKKSERMEF